MKKRNISAPGIISKDQGLYKVAFERIIYHPIAKVWDAITNPDQLKYWFTDIELELSVGSQMVIKFRDENNSLTYGKVLEVKAPNKFVWSWEEELAEWDLEEISPDTTNLKFTYSKLTTEFAVPAPAGFHILLDRLAARLQGNETMHAFGNEGDNEDKIIYETIYASEVGRKFPELLNTKFIRLEKYFDTSPALVWKAITDKDMMKQWYFDLSEFQPVPGFQFTFAGKGHKGASYMHICEVIQAIPHKLLQYSWEYEGFEGFSVVSFLLEEEGNGTKLTLNHHGMDSFPQDSNDFTLESFNGGWNYLINESLLKFLRESQSIN